MATGVTLKAFDPPRSPGWRRRAARTDGERLIAIGDIHGRWDLLDRLVAAIEEHVSTQPEVRNHLIFLGDFIDRGPESRRVIEFLRPAQQASPNVHVLLGNHEQALLHTIEGDPYAQQMWLEHGGKTTLQSFDLMPPRQGEDPIAFGARVAAGLGAETVDWLRDLPLVFRHSGYFFCHAGVRPGRPLARQVAEDLLWIREEFIGSERNHGAVIVHGHSITKDVTIFHNRIGIDTGAYRSGKLSAVILCDHGNWALTTHVDTVASARSADT